MKSSMHCDVFTSKPLTRSCLLVRMDYFVHQQGKLIRNSTWAYRSGRQHCKHRRMCNSEPSSPCKSFSKNTQGNHLHKSKNCCNYMPVRMRVPATSQLFPCQYKSASLCWRCWWNNEPINICCWTLHTPQNGSNQTSKDISGCTQLE